MRFGLFYEHQIPRAGWSETSDEQLLSDALEQVELADRLGIDSVWEVEHHFLEEYSHSSAPEVFLAAASQRTERIRLGHGIVQLPPEVNHPARVAERIATLDLVSGGRVEFGTGESSSQMELAGFGVDRGLKREMWEEALDAVTRMLVEAPFAGYEGRWIHMPPRNVVPKPKQRPHPPLWVACSRRDTIRLAARKGIGALSFAFIEPEEAREWVDEYYRIVASEECVPGGFAVNPNFAIVLPFMCHSDEQEALDRGIDGAHFFGYSLTHYYAFGEHRPGHTNVWEEFLANRDEKGFSRKILSAEDEPLGVKILQHGFGSLRGAIGTPGQIRDLIARYEEAGVDEVIFVAQAGPNRHEHICEALELFAAEVLPEFKERAADREAAKRERVAEACERALARRAPARPADPGYVVTPAGEPRPAQLIAAAQRGRLLRAPGAGSIAARLQDAGRSLLRTLVHGRSDRQLERVFGRRAVLRAIFSGMERAFVPEKAQGFQGEIQYELRSNGRVLPWVVRVENGRARAQPGQAADPQITFRVDLPTFARLVSEDEHAAKLFMEGRVEIEGDFDLAGRVGEMFGQQGMF